MCKLWTIIKKQDSKIQASEMAFLRGAERCSKLGRIKNEAIKEELQVFNLNGKLEGYKQRWQEHLERISLEIQTYKTPMCGRCV